MTPPDCLCAKNVHCCLLWPRCVSLAVVPGLLTGVRLFLTVRYRLIPHTVFSKCNKVPVTAKPAGSYSPFVHYSGRVKNQQASALFSRLPVKLDAA